MYVTKKNQTQKMVPHNSNQSIHHKPSVEMPQTTGNSIYITCIPTYRTREFINGTLYRVPACAATSFGGSSNFSFSSDKNGDTCPLVCRIIKMFDCFRNTKRMLKFKRSRQAAWGKGGDGAGQVDRATGVQEIKRKNIFIFEG